MRAALSLAALALVAACSTTPSGPTDAQVEAQEMALAQVPPMRWGERNGSDEWTRATMEALDREGVTMLSSVPHDIAEFCPNYRQLAPTGRKAFWAGLLSAVARHESTFNPQAAGGGGKWIGLMQIAGADAQQQEACGHRRLDLQPKLLQRARLRPDQVRKKGAGSAPFFMSAQGRQDARPGPRALGKAFHVVLFVR